MDTVWEANAHQCCTPSCSTTTNFFFAEHNLHYSCMYVRKCKFLFFYCQTWPISSTPAARIMSSLWWQNCGLSGSQAGSGLCSELAPEPLQEVLNLVSVRVMSQGYVMDTHDLDLGIYTLWHMNMYLQSLILYLD